MSISNNKISAPVSIEDVRQVLTASSRDLGELCKHPNINIWAAKKPVDNDNLFSRGTNSGIKATFDSSANPYKAALQTFTHDAPKGGEHSPYRLADFSGYDHNAPSPINSVAVSYNRFVTLNASVQPDGNSLTISDVVSAYGSLMDDAPVDENKPAEAGWYYCVVYLATDNINDLLLAWSDKQHGGGGGIVEEVAATRSMRSASGASVEGGDSGSDDEPSTTANAEDELPYEPDNDVASVERNGWEFETSANTYNLFKNKFGTDDASITYYFWGTASQPIGNCGAVTTIDATKIREPWNAEIPQISNCNYHLGFVCLANQKFDASKTYAEGDVQFLPLPFKKVKDAFFLANFDLDDLWGNSSSGGGTIEGGEVAG